MDFGVNRGWVGLRFPQEVREDGVMCQNDCGGGLPLSCRHN